MAKIMIFPGQGSQKKGMGQGLFDQFPLLERKVDEELGYSIRELCLNDPDGKLAFTEYTQVALYVVNALSYYTAIRSGQRPVAVAGHSLGEYNALLAAEVFDFRTGLRMVKRRAELMGRASGGAMAAVIGLAPERLRHALDDSGCSEVDIANHNSLEQVVISGLAKDLAKVEVPLRSAGAKSVIPLKVSGAFHSRFMEPARAEFESFLRPLLFRAPRLEVISNVTAAPHTEDSAKALLVQQIVRPVRWLETMQRLSAIPDAVFEEVGPGAVLSGLLAKFRAAA